METRPAEEQSYQRCLDKAFLLLGIRMQTEHELWEKLGKKSEKSDIWKVIERLKELNYVDDKKFAEMWVESRSHSRGPNLLRSELIKKGVTRNIIDISLATVDNQNQVDAATRIIKQKDKESYTKDERYKKLASLLARRGFSYDVIKKAINT